LTTLAGLVEPVSVQQRIVIEDVVGTGDAFKLVEAQSKLSVSAVAKLAILSLLVAFGYEPVNVTSKQPVPHEITLELVVP
jgi:hypothetical protein